MGLLPWTGVLDSMNQQAIVQQVQVHLLRYGLLAQRETMPQPV